MGAQVWITKRLYNQSLVHASRKLGLIKREHGAQTLGRLQPFEHGKFWFI